MSAEDPLDRFDGVDLETVVAAAGLQTRVDSKYLVTPHSHGRFLEALARIGQWRCLEIGTRRRFAYESVYFDTPDLLTVRQHRQGRRRRYKVRTRTYADSGECHFEVKLKGARGGTVKERLPYRTADADRLTPEARAHLARTLREAYGMPVPDDMAARLRTDYRRHTLVDLDGGVRVTCDEDLRCYSAGGRAAARELCLVEVKAARPGGPAERLLWSLGARPQSVSKYCLAADVLLGRRRGGAWARASRVCFGQLTTVRDG